MSRTFLAILLSSTVLFRVACDLLGPDDSDSYSSLYPFLEKWARTSRTKMLTVVFDDYEHRERFDLPAGILVDLNVSIRVVSLKHLISLRYKNMRRDYQTIESESCVLLIFSNVDHLREILNSPHLISFWHPENFYILQEQGQQLYDTFDHERFCKWAFERLWRFRRVYKLLLFARDKVIRSDPFDYAGRHTRYYANSSCDWYCIKSNEDSFLLTNDPNNTDVSDFFDEERKDFKLCPIKISIFTTTTMPLKNGKFSGLDYKYLEEVCNRMNVTPVLVQSKDKHGWEENGSFFGTIGHLVYEFADVTFNQFFIKDYLTRQLEFTTSITNDKLCVLVPKASPVPDSMVIVKIFTGEVWLLIFTGQFVISMIYTILRSKRNKLIIPQDMRRSVRAFSCYDIPVNSYFLEDEKGVALKIVPKMTEKKQYSEVHGIHPLEETENVRSTTKTEEKHLKLLNRIILSYFVSLGRYFMKVVLQLTQPFESDQPWFPERLLLMCSLFLTLILNGIVTSQLASSFSKRLYYEDINTLEELEETGFPILTSSKDIMEDALSDATSPLIKRLHMRLEYANESEVNRRLFEAKDAAFLHRHGTVFLKYNEYQRERLHVLKEYPKEYILANIMTKGSPFRDRINSILGRLNNGGFHGKWYQSLFQSQKRAAREQNNSTMHRKITIRHLFIPFTILYVGLATSVVVFIFEYRQNNVR